MKKALMKKALMKKALIIISVFITINIFCINVFASSKEVKLTSEQTRKMGVFIDNFLESGMHKMDIKNIKTSELINFGIWHNYRNNNKILKVQGHNLFIDKRYVMESVKKYFNIDIKVFTSTYYKYNGKGYTFTPADGEMRDTAKVLKVIDIGSGQYKVTGKLYNEMDPGKTSGTFTAIVKKYKYKNLNTYSIIKLDCIKSKDY